MGYIKINFKILICILHIIHCVNCEDISPTTNNNVKSNYLEQPFDHFNPLNNEYWKQMYFSNDEYYKAGGPIFIILGGESSIDESSLQEGSMMELCQKLSGIAFSVQHRFTGESFPINDTKLESLVHMNSQQVLADFANFIKSVKLQFSLQENKVILVGGSYPGTLAVNMRLKYPHLVHIVWASGSGGIHTLNFPEYYELMGRVLKETSQTCHDVVKESFDYLEKIIWTAHNKTKCNTGTIGFKYKVEEKSEREVETIGIIEETFTLCEPLNINNEDDIRNFFQYLAQQFYHIVQYNGRSLEYTVENICKNIFDNTTGNLGPVQKLSKFVNLVNEKTTGFQCIDFTEKKFCEQLGRTGMKENVTAGAFDDSRQWWWLTCSTLGNLQSSDSPNQPFGSSVTAAFLVRQCQCVFGERFTSEHIENQIENRLKEFGGIEEAKTVSRVVYVNGENDPWVSRGVLYANQTTPENRVIFIKGASHCFDMCASKPTDALEVQKARLQIFVQIAEWLLELMKVDLNALK